MNHKSRRLKHIILCCTCSLYSFLLHAQITDSIVAEQTTKNNLHFNNSTASVKPAVSYESFVVPAFMIAYGFTTLNSRGLTNFNEELKEEIWTEHPHKLIHIDNYLQFAPAVAVYGLNLAGIKGKNNLRDRSIIYIMSNVFLNTTVYSLKNTTKQQRPNGGDYSFPSGHTAEAFACAEFLRQEYKDVSPWYGIAGYTVAATTGLLRMYNNKHWLSDVVTGAGIGIASTKLAYWVYPIIKNKFFHHKEMNTMISPFYNNKTMGISCVYHFVK